MFHANTKPRVGEETKNTPTRLIFYCEDHKKRDANQKQLHDKTGRHGNHTRLPELRGFFYDINITIVALSRAIRCIFFFLSLSDFSERPCHEAAHCLQGWGSYLFYYYFLLFFCIYTFFIYFYFSCRVMYPFVLEGMPQQEETRR